MRWPQVTSRRISITGTVVAVIFAMCWLVYAYSIRLAFRNEAAYNSEMKQLHLDNEVKIRAEIQEILRDQSDGSNRRESTDRVFKILRLSRVAGNSREVMTWEDARPSPERTAVALKWARVAADEAAYHAALCERWERDFENGRMPHHITADEIRPFSMPEDWTENDLRHGRADRDE